MNTIRIGTRDSQLALWQAIQVQNKLNQLGYKTELVPLKATGDVILDKPLYELGITGVFTRHLDIAMLRGEIDIAVHSMKDVPTILPKGIVQAAVLERANFHDILVYKDNLDFLNATHGIVATSSLRRKAQWLNRYPHHHVESLRGNVQTRLNKLATNDWNGAIFAAAGLERINLRPENSLDLDWMIPAPAQGVIMITAMAENLPILAACEKINHKETEICSRIERDFLNLLEGGCSAPIGALAQLDKDNQSINFTGILLSQDGTKKIEVHRHVAITEANSIAKSCADEVIAQGGKQIMQMDGRTFKVKVLSTKVLTPAQCALFSDEFEVSCQPFIKTETNTLAPEVIKTIQPHVIFTSKNAVQALLDNFAADQLRFENLYCVGEETTKLVEEKFGKVTTTAPSSQALAEAIIPLLESQKVTYFCGNKRLGHIARQFADKEIELQEIEVYQTHLCPTKVQDEIDAVLFFSPSAVESFIQQNNTNKLAFCIGESTAQTAKKYFEKVHVARSPRIEDVIAEAQQSLMKQL